MHINYVFGSLTRISPLPDGAFEVRPLPRKQWGMGDYVVGEVTRPSHAIRVELPNGRFVEPMMGDWIVGAFGTRHATLEVVGDWRAIEEDGHMHVIGGGGVIGRITSMSPFQPRMIRLQYRGHVFVGGQPAQMQDYVTPVADRPFTLPVVLIIGTSMSAGKTTTAKVIVSRLCHAGQRVVAAKLAGSGRYHDVLNMKDAGAEWIFDFVDVGLPTTVCAESVMRPALRTLLSRMAALPADVAIIEVGASPLEPYNGSVAVEELVDRIRCTILAASDPYAVRGLIDAYERRPNLVTGIATNTQAGRELIEKLVGVPALNVRDITALPAVDALLRQTLALA